MQMASLLRGNGGAPGAGMFGGAGGMGGNSFPAPGLPGGDAATAGTPGAGANTNQAPNPFSLFGGMPNAGAGAAPGANPFGGMDPAFLQQILGGAGAGGPFGGAPFGGAGFGAPTSPPADTRSPEERFQVQLQVILQCRSLNTSGLTFYFSNCRTWDSRMPNRMYEHSLLLVGTCILRLSIS